MALTRRQSQSNTIIVIGLVVVIAAGLLFYLYTQFWSKGGANGNNTNGLRNPNILVNFDPTILQDPRVTGLQDFTTGVNTNVAPGQPAPFR